MEEVCERVQREGLCGSRGGGKRGELRGWTERYTAALFIHIPILFQQRLDEGS